MEREPSPAEERGTPVDCSETPGLLAEFVRRSLGRGDDQRLRTHIKVCRECRDLYRRTMAAAAHMGKELREERVAEEKRQRHEDLRRRAMAATVPPPKGRRFGLRLALIPAALILLLIGITRKEEEKGFLLRWSGGEVRAGGQLLSADRSDVRLESGDWCVTSGNARATVHRLEGGEEALLELGLGTQLLVEDPALLRARLQRGELHVHPPCTVTTAFGVLRVEDGRARLDLREGRFEVECLSGRLTFTGPTGEHVLAAGQRLASETPTDL